MTSFRSFALLTSALPAILGAQSSKPSLAETTRWIQQNLPVFATYTDNIVTELAGKRYQIATRRSVADVSIRQCVLRFSTIEVSGSSKPDTIEAAVYLRRVGRGPADVREFNPGTHMSASNRSYIARIRRHTSFPDTASLVVYTGHSMSASLLREDEVEIFVTTAEQAQRLAAAVDRAAELCGAKKDAF